jgi:hypothetical protein
MSLSAEMLTLHITTAADGSIDCAHYPALRPKEAERALYLSHMLFLEIWPQRSQLKRSSSATFGMNSAVPVLSPSTSKARPGRGERIVEVNVLFQRKCATGVSGDVDHNVPRLCVTRLFGQSRAPFVICLGRGNLCLARQIAKTHR